jgi:hypothetical protein
MKKSILFCSVAILFFCAKPVLSHAQTAAATTTAAADKPTTISGEVVDMDCYMSMGMSGASHKDCAAKCIANGQAMGLLTSDGKVYVLTADHSHGDAYNDLKKHAAEQVTVTGMVFNRGGAMSLEVQTMKAGS